VKLVEGCERASIDVLAQWTVEADKVLIY